MRFARKWLLLLSLAFAPLPAFAQSCGGFVDVFPSDFFCNNVEWIGNRNVTLGCTATQYCPNNNVLRSQMAAFLNRLGTVLTPTILRTIEVVPASDYDPFEILCESAAQFPVTDYPQQASFAATLMNFNASATKTVQGRLVYSTNDGASWTPTADAVMWQTVDPAERTTLALVGGSLDLNVGSSYKFAIQAQTNNPTATVQSECQLNVRIENRNSVTTPF